MLELNIAKQPLVIASQINFVVIGCGGTGGYLIRDLARLISVNNEKYDRHDFLTLVDEDQAELKNVARQNFISKDVGKCKAEVLAERYSAAFSTTIEYANKYITDNNVNDLLYGFFSSYQAQAQGNYTRERQINKESLIVIIGCVDNNKTRRIINNSYKRKNLYEHQNLIYIDSGNEETSGQIVTSFRNAFTLTRRSNYGISLNKKSFFINTAFEQFNMVANDLHPSDMSCADRAVSAPQNIGANIMAANIIFNICNQIIATSSKIINAYNVVVEDAPFIGVETEDLIALREKNDRFDYVNSILNTCTKIPYHTIFFNSTSSTTTAIDFSPEDQERF